jgi:exopolysaccharide biosynthesis polyprenyl glycosylphosphotransferase
MSGAEKTTIIVGAESELARLTARISRQQGDVRLLGWIGTDGAGSPSAAGDCLGGLKDLPSILTRLRPAHVVLAFPPGHGDQVQRALDTLDGIAAATWLVADFFPPTCGGPGGRPRVPVSGHWMPLQLTASQRLLKRTMDLLIALPLTVLALPLMLLAGLAVRLDSPGPVIFRQPRVGEGGRLFGMFKFRTMLAAKLEPSGREPKRPDDPRVTRVGRWLRRTSLDELPQLFNVLLGEMSLVGPRPELPINVAHYEPWQRERFAVPQGITGLWQINGRAQPMYAHTDQDIYYVRHRSLWLDLKILLRTPLAVLRGEGAF